MVLEYDVGLLETDLLGTRADLGRYQLLEVEDRVRRDALDPLAFAHPVVADHLDHDRRVGVVLELARTH